MSEAKPVTGEAAVVLVLAMSGRGWAVVLWTSFVLRQCFAYSQIWM